MDALLEQHQADKYHFQGFWQCEPCSFPAVCPLLYSAPLSLSPTSKPHLYLLTPEFLIGCSVLSIQSEAQRTYKRYTPIRWKRVEPFSEQFSTNTSFGFRLTSGKNGQDFYVDSSEKLDLWLLHLSKVAIMPAIEEEITLDSELGRGNYSIVYLGRRLADQQLVAVKAISKASLLASQNAGISFISEVEIMRKLDHSHILKVLNLYEDAEKYYIVLEYAEGGDLLQHLTHVERLSEAQAALFMKEMLLTLKYMHGEGVVHRDLKPDNILLMRFGDITGFKIADFGLAAEYSPSQPLALRCGSPGYVAPEILERQVYDSKVDIFSTGILLYIL